jgi:hypothetical protein
MILLKDRGGYYEPDQESLKEAFGNIETSLNTLFGGLTENYDCDDYALDLYARVRLYYRAKERLPVCFGQVIGTKFDGVMQNHTKNIFYSGGIYLVEPQTGEIKKADPKEDQVWFVEI